MNEYLMKKWKKCSGSNHILINRQLMNAKPKNKRGKVYRKNLK